MKARLLTSMKHSATIAGLLLLVAAPAYAQTGYPPGPGTTPPPAVGPTQDAGDVAGDVAGASKGTAFTGANIARGGIAGAASVGTGVLLVLGSRRRKAHESTTEQ
jgi:hypothetical protein